MVHVGVDLHKRMSQIAVLTEDGELVERRLANDATRLEQFFAQLVWSRNSNRGPEVGLSPHSRLAGGASITDTPAG